MASLYRKRALDSLTSPEELDRRTRVTRPWTWLILVAAFVLLASGIIWSLVSTVPVTNQGIAFIQPEEGLRAAQAPVAGTVELTVAEDDAVTAGQTIGTLADPVSGRRIDIQAPIAGKIAQTLVSAGEVVPAGARLAIVLPDAMELYARVFVPFDQRGSMMGEEVLVAPDGYPPSSYGYLKAHVVEVGDYAVTQERLLSVLQNRELRAEVNQLGPVVEVLAKLDADPQAPSGYAWTTTHGPNEALLPGTAGTAQVVVDEVHPISYVLGRDG